MVLLVGAVAVAALPLPVLSATAREAAATTSATSAELEFPAREYFLRPQMTIHSATKTPNPYGNIGGVSHFGQIQVNERSAGGSGLEYAVEDVLDGTHFNWCDPWPTCNAVSVGMDGETGRMFLVVDGAQSKQYRHVNDFDTQHVEISVRKIDTPLKIYREVMVHPTTRKPDCSDYPAKNEHRYRCLFLSEHLPSEPPTTTASIRDALPDHLIQAKENYSLVFAEEFNGTEAMNPSGPCHNRMNTLNQDYFAWNHTTDPCRHVDSDGTPCQDIVDGHHYIARAANCSSSLGTQGHFDFKYGYYETKYTINYDRYYSYRNFAMTLGSVQMPLKGKVDEYGIVLDDYESILIHLGGIVNVFEYIPGSHYETLHSWTNPFGFVRRTNTPPIRTSGEIQYCGGGADHMFQLRPAGFCHTGGTATVTKGVEWTPAGYRFLLKVHGVHEDFVMYDSSKVTVQGKSASASSGGEVTFSEHLRGFTAEEASDFLVHLTPGDAGSLLVQVGVSHKPLDIQHGGWGYPLSNERLILSKLNADYIRVYQPTNKYADIEPVFQ